MIYAKEKMSLNGEAGYNYSLTKKTPQYFSPCFLGYSTPSRIKVPPSNANLKIERDYLYTKP